jgi:hypothetical protein
MRLFGSYLLLSMESINVWWEMSTSLQLLVFACAVAFLALLQEKT